MVTMATRPVTTSVFANTADATANTTAISCSFLKREKVASKIAILARERLVNCMGLLVQLNVPDMPPKRNKNVRLSIKIILIYEKTIKQVIEIITYTYMAHHCIVDNSLDKHSKRETVSQRKTSLKAGLFSSRLLSFNWTTFSRVFAKFLNRQKIEGQKHKF